MSLRTKPVQRGDKKKDEQLDGSLVKNKITSMQGIGDVQPLCNKEMVSASIRFHTEKINLKNFQKCHMKYYVKI